MQSIIERPGRGPARHARNRDGAALGRDGRGLDDYLADHPELADDREALGELAFEEYRRRRLAHEPVTEEEYERRYGVDAFDWPYRLDSADAVRMSFGWEVPAVRAPIPTGAETTRLLPVEVEPAARSYLAFRRQYDDGADIDSWSGPDGVDAGAAKLLRDLHISDPSGAERFARAVASLPEPGSEFLGFRLVEELGRGAFGRVYLALQGELADRPVALKVSAEMPGESRTLARLQHTNIVPIYSAHAVPPLHAVCMPYFGPTTLGDVFAAIECGESLPDSGRALLETLDSKRSGLGSSRRGPASVVAGAEGAAEPLAAVAATPVQIPETLRMLGDLPFVEAVLWLGSGLADGLAHAHERGVLHRDLKPANILLTDDGQPMILDFNLADDSSKPEGAAVGGTLPYMAPEGLAQFRGGDRPIDARSDLYAVGVILFEMLTGRHPFPVYTGGSTAVVGRMIEDRSGPPPGLRAHNPRVTPAVESIVRHLLEPDPGRRYASARDLREDIERHLANLPLKHAPEPSPRERARKWARRHPRITSGSSIATMAGAVLLGLAALLFARGQRLARLEAYDTYARFREDLDTAEYLLNTQASDPVRRAEGTTVAHRGLALYKAEVNPAWRETPVVTALDPPDRDRLAEDVGEMALVLARALAFDAADRPAGPSRTPIAEAGLRACDLAAACYGADKEPKSLWSHRAELTTLLGRAVEAKALLAKAEQTPMRTARDRYRAATDLAVAGEYRRALPLALEATRDDPRRLGPWLTLAFCHDRLEQNAEAAACYGTCIALRPEFPYAWLNRGIVQDRRDEFAQAVADFDRVATLRPDWYEPYLHRGHANLLGKKPAEALPDFDRAMQRGGSSTRALFYRAMAREKLGDAEGARRDREEGLRREPTDAWGWFTRGFARMGTDPAAALADFQQALRVNPRLLPAMQNSIYILWGQSRRDEASALLDKLIALYPDHAPARSARGVLLALKGEREAAIREAKESLWRDASPKNVYQVAGIYATTSRKNPDDRLEAMRLLSTALRGGFGFDELPEDHELDAIRNLPEFRELLAAAKALVKPGPSQ